MGYYTSYTLDSDHSRTKLNIPDGIESKYDMNEFLYLGCVDETKWYSHIKDMLLLSKANPDVEFLTSGVGEEQGDIWEAKFLNGKYKIIRAKIVMEKYSDVGWQE